MRFSLVAALSLACACAPDHGAVPEPPALTVTSPARATVQDRAGTITVTGVVSPGPSGAKVADVTVNGVAAAVATDGSFTASVPVAAGATFLHTVASDTAGGKATDTRTLHAGELRDGTSLVEQGLTVALSDDALGTMAAAASTLMKTTAFGPMLAPRNPMVSAGADNGEDCLWGKVYVDDLDVSGAKLSLVPSAAGLAIDLEVTGLDVPARARYAALCLDGSTTLRMTAQKLSVRGTVRVTPRANRQGFDVKLVSPQVAVTGFQLVASGLPGDVLEELDLDTAIGSIVAKASEVLLDPLLNQALGSLAGPKQVVIAGKPVDFQVAANAVGFDVAGAKVSLDTRMGLAGRAARFVYTPNQAVRVDAGNGVALAISDDAINQLLASVTAAGMLSFTMPATGGTFDAVAITAAMPPMVVADGQTGKLRLLAGELRLALLASGQEVAHVALQLAIEVSAGPSAFGLRLFVEKPEVFVDVLDNVTGYEDADKEALIKLVIDHQVKFFSLLLGNVPLPTFAGLSVTNASATAADGYLRVAGTLR